jgi:hypothetical protein
MRAFDCTASSGINNVEDLIGIILNNKEFHGFKMLIEDSDVLYIPENYEYFGNYLNVNGIINCEGIISI